MWHSTKHAWADPLAVGAALKEQDAAWALLYSGMQTSYSGRYSYLALNPIKTIAAEDFTAFSEALSVEKEWYANAWFGYLGYPLRHCLETLPENAPGRLELPALWMTQFAEIWVFDHVDENIVIHCNTEEYYEYLLDKIKNDASGIPHGSVLVDTLESNMSKDNYLAHVKELQEAILRGDLYQANLTRKFFGTINNNAHPFDIFSLLCELSPAPYSSFLQLGEAAILSSSPEQFLHITTDGRAETRPIKGSAARIAEDEVSRAALAASEKDRAENLMIVDLMRNDLSRGCEPGSVIVDSLFDVTSYATIHHMSSTITGQKRGDVTPLELVQHCFPPGSMTGTPKIKAMELCTALEQQERGVYSGAIGWFGGDGRVDLSVVIRTMVIQGDYVEFQVGGAIVADSDPEKEWEETLFKATALAKALGIPQETLRAL